ncbi:MAG: hypothetical protein KDB14_27005, partial [Planctomycetales bacterium]|nr:hypothetical protein [Planctomycetales bacterium]
MYDAAENRLFLTVDGASTTYTYDAANQLEASEDSTGVTNYTFDANGNQHVVEAPDGTKATHGWDCENQTVLTELPAGVKVTATPIVSRSSGILRGYLFHG